MRLVFLAVLLALGTGCASVGKTPVSTEQTQAAEQLFTAGNYADAAKAWAAIAEYSRGEDRELARLHAADAWLLAGDGATSAQWLALIKAKKLPQDSDFLYDLLSAHRYLAEKKFAEAAALVNQNREAVPKAQRSRWHRFRAQLFAAQGDGFASVAEQAWLLAEQTSAQRQQQGLAIDAVLAKLKNAELAQRTAALPVGHPLYPYAGRALTQRGLPLPRPYQHSGLANNETLPAAEADGYRPPLRVAVLLPLSGPLAPAGHSVRDGLLTAYFGENRRRPSLRFYDTAPGLDKALASAQADAAQLLIGPLSRDEVTQLFARANTLPTLALNRAATPPPEGNTAFALAPEDEGSAAADRLFDRGLSQVLVVRQNDDAAVRALSSFHDRLLARGGQIVGEVTVEENSADVVPPLQRAITAAAATPPQALFLAMKAAPARVLAAQLPLLGLDALPKVATSLILSGGNARMDVELEGIEYPELPWLLGQREHLPDADALARSLPTAQGGGARLFAFGLDAWRIAAYLQHLREHPEAVIPGATGELRLDGFGNVQRDPDWAIFRGGHASPAPDGALIPDASDH